ncbi:disks large-associated protein 5-like [Lineus longissimus]|uniref:disks large-associated protein 5-like n=1 Tax=Lineus longissimus TaxID=88925 RepID=UPI002B4D0D23
MDRAKSYLYKKKTAVDGVDKRVLRAHQKTVEQKSRRNEAVQKKRNIQPDPSETIKKAATKDQALSRKGMLAKWKEERELKRKLEARDRKKPGFKVVKVDHQDSDVFSKSSSKSVANMANVTQTGKKDTKQAKRQQSTTQAAISTTKPEVCRRQTRSSTTMPPSTRVTRNNKSKPAPQTKNTKKGKENAPESTRRTSSKTKSTAEKAKASSTSSSGTDSESSGSGVCLFNAKTVRIGRGDQGNLSKSGSESESFAPMDFTFTAPATVKPFILKPLTPTSAVRFFSGTDSSEEELVPTFESPAPGKNSSVARSPVESSFQPVSFYGNKENKTPASSKSRQSIRRSLAISSTSASETEAEVSMSAKGRKKSIANEKPIDSPRKSSRRSRAHKSGAGEKVEDVSGAVETSELPTPSASRRRKSVRASLAASSASASESESEVSKKGRQKSLASAAEKPVDSPRKSVRRSCAPKSSAGEKVEDINGAVEEDKTENMEVAESQIAAERGVLENAPTPTASVPYDRITSTSKDIDHFSKTPVPLSRSTKKTQRVTCRTLAKLKSPEERVEVLSRSPMIEMTRRTPKTKSPVDHYLPAFDDSDFLGPPPPMASMDEPEDMPVEPILDQQHAGTTQGVPCDSTHSEPEHDMKYFRALLVSETDRLNGLSATWDEINEKTDGLNEDLRGQIRTTSGQAQLLISQRFKQFRGLVDNCEFNTGLKPVDCSDLQGFWDMVYFQVEDVNDKFDKLEKLKASGWVMDKPKVKKVLKKKTTATVKPAIKITARSKFADFRAKMKQQKPEEQPATAEVDLMKPVTPKVDITKPMSPKSAAERSTTPEEAERNSDKLKTFEGGFFQIASPVRVVPPTPTTSTTPKTTATTPSERRSLVKTAVVNSARRSGGIPTEMPKSAKKARQSLGIPSPLLPGCMAETRTTQNSYSAASPQLAPRSSIFLGENTPTISETVTQKTSSTTPALEALRLDDSISGDDQKEASSPRKTPARRSSVRKTPKADKSVKFSSNEMDVDEDFVSKYCMPTIKESTSKPVLMEVDPFEHEIKDAEMPGQMKRDLKDEFDKHSKSAEKMTKCKSVASALKTAKKTPAAIRRRSVRFVQSPGVNDEMAAPLPRTPFNRDSCTVPQRRRSSRLSSSSSMGSCSGRVSTPRPTKPWLEDLLMLDSPLTSTDGPAKVVGSLLFTPAESASAAPTGSDLICFSPVVSEQTPKRRKVEPVRRRSTRTASRSEESLL